MGKIFNITIDEEVQKALEWDIVNVDEWLHNAVFNKARQCGDKICELAINDKAGTILSPEDRQALKTFLANQGIDILTSINQLPPKVKKEIIKRANIKSAAERKAEEEARLAVEEEARRAAEEAARLAAEEAKAAELEEPE